MHEVWRGASPSTTVTKHTKTQSHAVPLMVLALDPPHTLAGALVHSHAPEEPRSR